MRKEQAQRSLCISLFSDGRESGIIAASATAISLNGPDPMQERRKAPTVEEISPELIQNASQQLEAEIKIIEGWLHDLDETREDNMASLAARKSYNDMLQSRRELLNTLKNQPH